MTCDTVERENIIERYLTGRLEAGVKEEWELHYFGCDRCAQQLETCQTVEKPLRAMASEIRQEIPQPSKSRTLVWVGAGIAAALLLAAGTSLFFRAPVADRTALAQLDPPAYTAPVLRGVESKAELQFQQAMKPYQRGDYEQAIIGLHAALELDSTAAAPRFFLGACELMTGRVDVGIRDLRTVAEGSSPFAEEAAFDLAKGYIRQANPKDAAETLKKVAAMHGDFSSQAEKLMERISGPR